MTINEAKAIIKAKLKHKGIKPCWVSSKDVMAIARALVKAKKKVRA